MEFCGCVWHYFRLLSLRVPPSPKFPPAFGETCAPWQIEKCAVGVSYLKVLLSQHLNILEANSKLSVMEIAKHIIPQRKRFAADQIQNGSWKNTCWAFSTRTLLTLGEQSVVCRFRDGNFIQWTYLLLERKAKCFFSSRHLRRSWIKMDSDCSDVSSVAIGPMAMGAGAPWNTHSTGIFQRLHLARRKALVSLEIPEQCHVWSGPKLKIGWMWYGHPSHNGNSYSGCIYDEICIYVYVCM